MEKQPLSISWDSLAAEMDSVMMPADQISEHHRTWHSPGADHVRLAAAIRADIEQRRPEAADITQRLKSIIQASKGMTSEDWKGDPSTIVERLKERAGLDKKPKRSRPPHH